MHLLFIVPLFMLLAWTMYLHTNGYTLKQGIQGYKLILGFNAVIIGFLVIMLFITH